MKAPGGHLASLAGTPGRVRAHDQRVASVESRSASRKYVANLAETGIEIYALFRGQEFICCAPRTPLDTSVFSLPRQVMRQSCNRDARRCSDSGSQSPMQRARLKREEVAEIFETQSASPWSLLPLWSCESPSVLLRLPLSPSV